MVEQDDAGEEDFETISAEEFAKKKFPPLKLVVPGVLPEGTIILAGPPKTGKSFLALSLAVSVATGRPALGQIPVRQRGVLYLALEDGDRRTQGRFLRFLGEDKASLDFSFKWKAVGNGCVENLEAWIESHPTTGLIVIDTAKRIRPKTSGRRGVYDEDYEFLAPLSDFAHKKSLCILIVHHTRKTRKEDDGDPMERVSGSTGMTGAVDGTLVLSRKRNSLAGTLQLMHRDLPDDPLSVALDPNTMRWMMTGPVPAAETAWEDDGPCITPDQQKYIDMLRRCGQMRPKEIAAALSKNPDAVRQMLHKLVDRGLLETSGGQYWVPEPADDSPAADQSDHADGHGDQGTHTAHGDHTAHPGDAEDADTAHTSPPADVDAGDQGTHTAHSAHTPPPGHGATDDQGAHTAHGSLTGSTEERDRVSGVSTPSVPLSAPSTDRPERMLPSADELPDFVHISVLADRFAEEREARKRVRYSLFSCHVWPLSDDRDYTQRSLDDDSGVRTEVNVTFDPWPADGDPDQGARVTLECGHGKTVEEIDYRTRYGTRRDDVGAMRVALVHHVLAFACDCIRPLWNLFYEERLIQHLAQTLLYEAGDWMEDYTADTQTRFWKRLGPPARTWQVTPQKLWEDPPPPPTPKPPRYVERVGTAVTARTPEEKEDAAQAEYDRVAAVEDPIWKPCGVRRQAPESLNHDAGRRTMVHVVVREWNCDDEQTEVIVACGHGRAIEVVDFRAWEPIDDEAAIRNALAHHALTVSCDCIRTLWQKYFGEPLNQASAQEAFYGFLDVQDEKNPNFSPKHKLLNHVERRTGEKVAEWHVTPEQAA